MNINIFEKTQQSSSDYSQSDTSSHEDVANLKLKIEKRKTKQKRLKVVLITLVASVLVLSFLFGYSQYKLYSLSQEEMNVSGAPVTDTKQGAQQTVQADTIKSPEAIIKALGRHILLPEGTPQIAEVKDVEKLKEKQAFFKNAENGDIVVVYETTIFLYRPTLDIVIASGDISGIEQKNP